MPRDRKQYQREYWKQNRERLLAYKRQTNGPERRKQTNERRRANLARYYANSIKARAKKRGLAFDLKMEDIQRMIDMSPACPCCGVEYSNAPNDPKNRSIDRIDNSLGYLKSNVHIICWRCNRVKADATPDELKRVAEYIDAIHRVGRTNGENQNVA